MLGVGARAAFDVLLGRVAIDPRVRENGDAGTLERQPNAVGKPRSLHACVGDEQHALDAERLRLLTDAARKRPGQTRCGWENSKMAVMACSLNLIQMISK